MIRRRFNVSVRLRKSVLDVDLGYVVIAYTYGGKERIMATKDVVPVNQWNASAKKVIASTDVRANDINSRISGYVNYVIDEATRLSLNGIEPVPSIIAELFTHFRDNTVKPNYHTSSYELQATFQDYVNNMRYTHKASTINNYRRTLELLIDFKPTVCYEDVKLSFLRGFQAHLLRKMSASTVSKHFDCLRKMFSDAIIDKGLSLDDRIFKLIKHTRKAAFSIALSDDHVNKIASYEGPYSLARDWMLILCYIGARPSDALALGMHNVSYMDNKPFLCYTPMKTERFGIEVKTPIHPRIAKYFTIDTFPATASKATLNKQIKKVAMEVGLTEIIPQTGKPLWKHVKMSVGRRTFATRLYRSGMPLHILMQLTGHRTERMLRTYLRLDVEEYALEASRHLAFAE